jgi:Concanavalin A-like lectin/glucanases superfamily/Secretion system C-terminal sorting domain
MKSTLLLALSLALSAIVFSQAPTSGLVAYWPMNGSYTDAGPNSIAGTNFASTATANKVGTANAAMEFANPNATATIVAQYATHAINSNVNFTAVQDFSIAFSVFINSPVIHPCGLYDNNLNYGGPGVWFWNQNGFPQIQFNYRNGSVGSTNGALTLGVWRHICVIRQSPSIKIYINGVLNNTGTEGATASTYSFPARFGTMFSNTFTPPQYNGLNGKLDELRIYNRALTAAEITSVASNALPVTLMSFTATLKDNQTQLNWQTAQEQNSSHFEIERSIDGINFSNIGKINANGNSSTSLDYSYNDKLSFTILSEPKIYYRLKSVDIDGKFDYSKIVVVLLKKIHDQLIIFPTPTKQVLNIQTASILNDKATILITDVVGKLLMKKEVNLFIGNNSFPLDVSTLKSGLYHVQLNTNSNSYTRLFMKVE